MQIKESGLQLIVCTQACTGRRYGQESDKNDVLSNDGVYFDIDEVHTVHKICCI